METGNTESAEGDPTVGNTRTSAKATIESVIRVLKTQTQLEHTRHRNLVNFQVNVVSETLIAYQLLENKSSLNLAELQEINDLPMLF